MGKATALKIHDEYMTDFMSLSAVSCAAGFLKETLNTLDINMLGHLLDRPGLAEAVPERAAGLDPVRAVVKRAKRETTS